MATLKDKMSLYATRSKHSTQGAVSNEVAIDSSENQGLDFEGYHFDYVSDGFYIYKNKFSDPKFGKKKLSSYLPWEFSSILEMSSTRSDDVVYPDEVLFLDTETTGLNRSGATIAFLIGTAYFENSSLATELLFIQNPVGEGAALDYLMQIQKKFRYLVSYNGKSFDIPLIRNRMILNRKKGLRIAYHFDLLHIFRRLFVKGTVGSWSQQEMEKELLDFHRVGDLPGSAIPQMYFDYVKYKHDSGFSHIFKHNELDVLGLAFLFLEAIRIYNHKDTAPRDMRSGLARILLRNNKDEEALHMLVNLSVSSDLSQVQYRDRLLLATLYRQKKQIELAVNVFMSLVSDFDCPVSHISLAKIYEHKFRDFDKALQHSNILLGHVGQYNSLQEPSISCGIENVEKPELLGNTKYNNDFVYKKKVQGIFSHDQIQHRIKRIERKINNEKNKGDSKKYNSEIQP